MPFPRLPLIGLRLWLFSLMLASMVPLVLLSASTAIKFDHALQAVIFEDLKYRTHDLGRLTEHVIAESAAEVSSMADSRSAQVGDWPVLYEHAKRAVARNQLLRAVTLIDDKKNVVFHTGVPFGAPLFTANDPGSVDAVMQTGRVKVSGAFKAPISPRLVVAVSVPLRQNGQIRYVLRAILLTQSFDRLLLDAELPPGWVAGITDSQGRLLARSLAPESSVGRMASPSFLEGMRRGDGRPFEGATLEGERTTSIVLPLHGKDWYLGVAVPNSILAAGLRQAILQIAGLATLGLGLALLLSFLCSSYLLRQVRLLVDAMTRPGTESSGRARLKVKELVTLLDGVSSARQREQEATSNLNLALVQRDEITDLYERAPCGYHSLNAEGRLIRMNETALRWLGYRWEELQGRHFTDLLTPAGRAAFGENFARFTAAGHIENLEFDLVRKDGSTFPVSINATAIKDPEGRFLSSRSTTFDVTETRRLQSQLDQLARTDMLTGLSNRRDFHERASRELLRCQRHHRELALLMLDVDHFKQINDTHGHEGGDRVLQTIATACRATLRNVDLIARIGGEEFAVMLPETSPDLALQIAERLCLAIGSTDTELASGETVAVTVSIGLTQCEPADVELDKILVRADEALYVSKHAGRNRVSVASGEPMVRST